METKSTKTILFETSWEVCNKVGGIHTVLVTKAQIVQKYYEKYILIGPDFQRDTPNTEFQQDDNLYPQWRKKALNKGIRARIGRWKIKGKPIVILVDFCEYLAHNKDQLLKKLWEDYKVDSINSAWDYAEPVGFGYMAAKTIDSFTKFYHKQNDTVIAHFHEWMTCSGALYLHKYSPQIATVFTTHATVTGRAMAGNGIQLYDKLKQYNADEIAAKLGIMAKHTLEKAAAQNTDAFSTVSQITAKECSQLLGKMPMVTPNGFDDSFLYPPEHYKQIKQNARNRLTRVAARCLGINKQEWNPLIVMISGRYEYRNKGIDVFLEAIRKLKDYAQSKREILVYIMVPAQNNGPRRDLHTIFVEGNEQQQIDPRNHTNTTHTLTNPEQDQIIQKMRNLELKGLQKNVNVIFVPSYLDGNDGVFDMQYYELLVAADVTVFPSYYEPWGYTPLESIAFGVPTITTTLAGFGLWVEEYAHQQHTAVTVLQRGDTNKKQVVDGIVDKIIYYAGLSSSELQNQREKAVEISKIALWKKLYKNYQDMYLKAQDVCAERLRLRGNPFNHTQNDGGEVHEQVEFIAQQASPTTQPKWTRMLVQREFPRGLGKLQELTLNLWWSWNDAGRKLFGGINPQLWALVDRNPIALLDKLTLTDLRALIENPDFMAKLDRTYTEFRGYMDAKNTEGGRPRVAYFSMEYGLHASLKIYSGGLGILAGDYLKESSDKNVPMVAVGLLYRYGYFSQRLSNAGEQEVGYEPQNFDKLPITPLRNKNGEWKTVQVGFPGRTVIARIWRCEVGRTILYLMDTDHELNQPEDRSVTHHLYGGDWDNRLRQEFLLGIGGIRLINELGIEADVFHCNEGHAAFIGLERARQLIINEGLSFSEALEVVRSSSLFTTHTPVPAGHDEFDEGMIRQYMWHFPDKLKIDWEQFYALGKATDGKFSMSVLACNLSQEVNGVSWLHGQVSKKILDHMWQGYMPNELHIGYVTNGVHFPTWTADRLKDMYYTAFGDDFKNGDYSKTNWDRVWDIPDDRMWDARLYLKNRLLKLIHRRLTDPTEFRFDSPRQLIQIQESLKPDTLTIGFARRFATYKRAHLLFTNLERLDALVNNPKRPVQFVFAGKAHPADSAGQDLIKRIVEVSKLPQFTGKIIFLQNYDMELARRIVQGVDVWLNTPTRPLEASGTSGQKCVMNGVLQFSVLDGWWVEGYRPDAGWMLPMERTFEDQKFQDELDAEMIYTTIEDQIVPTYYDRNDEGFSAKWIQMIKHCVADVASNFTTNRMMQDYQDRFYQKLYNRNRMIIQNDFDMARNIAAWKRRVARLWDGVKVLDTHQFNPSREAIVAGNRYKLQVDIELGGLKPQEIGVELIVANTGVGKSGDDIQHSVCHNSQFIFDRMQGDIAHYTLETEPELTGAFDVAVRVYPKNPLLPHRQDFALVSWA